MTRKVHAGTAADMKNTSLLGLDRPANATWKSDKSAEEKPPAPSKRARRRRSPTLWLMLPAIFLLVLLVLVPLGIAGYSSLTDLNEYTIGNWIQAPFIGIHNFVTTLTSPAAAGGISIIHSALVSVTFALVTTLVITPIGIAAALVASVPSRLQGVIRSLFILPYAIPPFVNAILWRFVFLNGGLADRLLADVHLAKTNTYWLLGPHSFWALVIADSWASWPFIFLLTLAGLQGIPNELYDAACVDGATRWTTLMRITMPQLRRVLLLAFLLSTINHLNNFTLPYVMFGTPPPSGVNVIPLNIYVTSFSTFQFGIGAAMGVLSFVVLAIPAVMYIRASRLTRGGARA